MGGKWVLTFHRQVEDCQQDHDVSWKSFHRLLDAITASGVPVAPLTCDGSWSTRSLILTFDDGTEDHARVGDELAERGMVGVFFVPAGLVGMSGHLSLGQIRRLHAMGHTVASHGFRHVALHDGMSPAEIDRELGYSKTVLEDYLGIPILYFAPPGGRGQRLVSREVPKYGYEASRSMKWGAYNSVNQRWNIPCLPVTELTLAQGWIMGALGVPAFSIAMQLAWGTKSLLPASIRRPMRAILHRRFKTIHRQYEHDSRRSAREIGSEREEDQ